METQEFTNTSAERRATIRYTLQLFQMGLGIAPNMKQVEKGLKELSVKIPKSLHSSIGLAVDVADEKDPVLIVEMFGDKASKYGWTPFAKLADAQAYFANWSNSAIQRLDSLDDDNFDFARGRNTETERITFNGRTDLLQVFAMEMITGSKLEGYFRSGLGDISADDLTSLNKILNVIKTATHGIIPDNIRKQHFGRKKDEAVITNEVVNEPQD